MVRFIATLDSSGEEKFNEKTEEGKSLVSEIRGSISKLLVSTFSMLKFICVCLANRDEHHVRRYSEEARECSRGGARD